MANNLKALLTFVYLTSSLTPAQAAVIGLGNSKKNLEFNRYVENTPNLTSLRSAYLDREFSKSAKTLKSKYELAVKGLLLEDLKPSIFVFKEITAWPSKHLLNRDSPDIVLKSHMRLAHLDQPNSDFWLKHALYFKPSYKPETGEFNPQVSGLLEKKRKEQNPYLYSMDKNDVADADTLLFVNGVQVLDTTKIHPSGKFKFTFLKNGFDRLDIEVRGEDITKVQKVKLKELSLGTCKSPNFKKHFGIQIEKIYFSKDCIRSIQDQQIRATVKNEFQPTSDAIKNQPMDALNTKKHQKKNLFQKKTTWYVIGAAVLAGTIASSLSRGGTTTVVPVER